MMQSQTQNNIFCGVTIQSNQPNNQSNKSILYINQINQIIKNKYILLLFNHNDSIIIII